MAETTLPQRARLHVAVARGLDWVWPHGAAWAYADALRWAPRDPELHFRRGGALGRAGRWHESARTFASAARLQPRSLEYQCSLVVALDRAGRVEELFAALRRLCELRPDEGELSVLLGAVLLRHGRRAEAIKVFRWAVRLSPGHERRRFVLGEALLGTEGWVRALDSWQGARQLSPESVAPAEPVEGRSVLHLHPGRRRERPSRKPARSWGNRFVTRLLVRWTGLGTVVRRAVVEPVAGDERERRVRALRRAWRRTHPRATRWPVVLLSLRRRAPDESA
jgi:tetratricopeptide (TPR) repeat protein